jgi:hypothetical protein
MRKLTSGFAGVMLAGSAILGGVATASPAAATGGDGLVNVYTGDILSDNQVVVLQNVAVPVAAALCGVNANILSAQLDKGDAKCPALTTLTQKAWVSDN